MILTLDLEGQGHVVFLMVDFVGVHVKTDASMSLILDTETLTPKMKAAELKKSPKYDYDHKPAKC